MQSAQGFAEGAPNVFTPPDVRAETGTTAETYDPVQAWTRYTVAKGPMLTCCGSRCSEPFEAVAQRFDGVDADTLNVAVTLNVAALTSSAEQVRGCHA